MHTYQGNTLADRRPMSRIWCSVTAEKNGEVQSNSSNLAGRRGMDWFTDERIRKMCKEAVDRTIILFEARRPPAGELPVVLAAGASGILLHEAVGHGMEADFNRKGTSIYSTMIGEQVAPETVTIVDSALHPNERGALNVDDEGNPTERTVLVGFRAEDAGGILTHHGQTTHVHAWLPEHGTSGHLDDVAFLRGARLYLPSP